MRLVLPIIYRRTESDFKIDAEIPLDDNDFIIKYGIFYRIDCVEPVKNSDKECNVRSGGSDYRVALPMQEVDKRIMKQRYAYEFN